MCILFVFYKDYSSLYGKEYIKWKKPWHRGREETDGIVK
jgi:hypothetical protein